MNDDYDDEPYEPYDSWCDRCGELLDSGGFGYGRYGDECYSCGLSGCIDDLCHGQGYCMHGGNVA